MPADLTSEDNLVIGAIRALLAYSSKISHLIETCESEARLSHDFHILREYRSLSLSSLLSLSIAIA